MFVPEPHPDQSSAAKFSVLPVSESPSRVELRFAGNFPIVWPEQIAAALAPRAITIQSAEAERHGNHWTGQMILGATERDHDIASLDFESILRTMPQARQPRPIAILRSGLVRLKETLRLAIQANDRQGFLVDLLTKLKHLGLYARRLTIDSNATIVTQCFWLTGYSGSEPDLQSERELREFIGTCRRLRRA